MENMPKKTTISFDAANFFLDDFGIDLEQLKHLSPELDAARNKLKKALVEGSVGYLSIPERKKDIAASEEMAKYVRKNFDTLLVLGIGGSDLGARTLIQALQPKKRGVEVLFLGANTDPEEIAEVTDGINWKKTAINIVSKSGGTIEPMSTFLFVREQLIKKVGEKKHAAHIIATTDRAKGTMRDIANREGYRSLSVPDDIGGRWSALTSVGLFPALCAGIASGDLLRGAKEMRDRFMETAVEDNDVLKYSGLHHLAYIKQNRNITVLMPYAARLDNFGRWFRQLWAESLGNRSTRDGRVAKIGLTPVAALGATDQHSQVQLYVEGPDDKMITFIEVEQLRQDFTVPQPYPDLEGVAYYGLTKFSKILHTERSATAHALANAGKPNGTITIAEINADTIGGLMMFFMLATSVMGELLNVNAYDQPGVEDGKHAMSALLGREGYTLDE